MLKLLDLNELVKFTLWNRGHGRNVFRAVQLDAELAKQVNLVDIENGSVSPWQLDPATLKQESWGEWTYQQLELKPYRAKAGDWLCTTKLHSGGAGMYVQLEFPYNRAQVFPAKYFAERARYIDDMH